VSAPPHHLKYPGPIIIGLGNINRKLIAACNSQLAAGRFMPGVIQIFQSLVNDEYLLDTAFEPMADSQKQAANH